MISGAPSCTSRKADYSSFPDFFSLYRVVDRNLRQDSIKRKAERAARNLDTIQRMVLALIAVWKNRRKKISDKQKGTAQIIRELAVSFTNVLHFLAQK